MNGSRILTLAGLMFAIARATSADGPDLDNLRNPVWVSKDNLRDPSVLKTQDGYHLFYSRLSAHSSGWANPSNWHIAQVFTRDFVTFTNDRNVSPPGCASPGDVVWWHGRWVLPYQTYPTKPTQLVFAESTNLVDWSAPKPFLMEALNLPWNELRRVIDPSFVVDGDTLHCWFVGSAYRTNESGARIRGNLMGHALTRDPKLERWEILTPDQPLIGFSERAPDGVENTMIFRTGAHWTMIYSEGLAEQHLAVATSTNLVDWTLGGAIELPRQRWFTHKYGAPFVWREKDRWLMILMGAVAEDRTTFGLLSSDDGERWQLLPEGSTSGLFPAGVRRVVFLGDSITYSGQYVDTVVAYHKARFPDVGIEFINVGLHSETVSGLSEPEHLTRHKFARPDLHERLGRVLEKTKPDLVFACYGMNDGIYLPLDEQRFKAFRDGIEWLHAEVRKTGANIVHITPPVFDESKGGHPGYAAVLDRYSEWLVSQRTNGWDVVDLHSPMQRFLVEQRAVNAGYAFSRDGIHPDDAGHWLMAQSILIHLGAEEAANASGAGELLARFPGGDETLRRERDQLSLWKDAWLTAIGHQRPGLRKGRPIQIDPATGQARWATDPAKASQ